MLVLQMLRVWTKTVMVCAGDDCDDTNALSFPGADEICDESDNNCNGEIDEEPIDGTPFYGDSDLDGYGDPNQLLKACSESEGIADNAYDCDDSDPAINPDAEEVCDEVDNNCDNVVDYDAVDRVTYYRDIDGDGYGIEAGAQVSCEQPEGFASEAGDCDDAEENANPGASETCDGIDNDCDGTVDVGVLMVQTIMQIRMAMDSVIQMHWRTHAHSQKAMSPTTQTAMICLRMPTQMSWKYVIPLTTTVMAISMMMTVVSSRLPVQTGILTWMVMVRAILQQVRQSLAPPPSIALLDTLM